MGQNQSSKSPFYTRARILILWARLRTPLYSQLRLDIVREVCMYLTNPEQLALVTKTTLQYFDLETQQLEPEIHLESQIELGRAMWIVVDSYRVFLCLGGEKGDFHIETPRSTALFLHRSGQVDPLPDMHFSHISPGLLFLHGSVHVFGSSVRTEGTQCESLAGTEWNLLPEMRRPRSCFTPVVWRSAVYLCGGAYNYTVEVYDGNTMRLLDIILPDASPALSCLYFKQLVVLTRRYKVILEMENRTGELEMKTISRNHGAFSSNSACRLWEDVIYNVEDGNVIKYSVFDGNRLETH